uniref:Follistatin n=1 Tax=Anopheles atroparvus TaxID=41427 RepID=A0A182IUF3_ANOAO
MHFLGPNPGTCWLRRIESTGKCSQLFARNVTRESCCAAGSGAKGFSEKDITDVGLFFINAFNDGMECSSCLDTCDRAKCAPNKRCVMRRNRPKCICAPTCSGGGRGPKRNNRVHRMQQVQQQRQQHELQPHFHQQNIKVINLSESQRNRRQYFADDGRQPRPRQLRYTGPEDAGAVDRDAHRRSVKKFSLSEPRSPQSSQRASAKHRAQDSDKERIDKEHNLLESVTLPIPVNCTASGAMHTAGCPTGPSPAYSSASSAPETPGWTGGERMVLLQHGPANGLALNHHPGKGSGRVKVHPAEPKTTPKPPTASSTGRHHRKVLAATPAANQTMLRAASHRNLSVNEPPHKSTVTPFAAFGKPKLLRVPKQGDGRHNGTARGTVRVPRREPQYLDDVFFVDNYHHRKNPHHREAAMDDFFGNEIMQHSSFYNPVCGTDGKTYKTECQLKKRACRQEIASLVVAYKGHCQTSCKFVKCPDGQRCIEDQNASPHCVTCGGAECRSDRSPKSVVCGTDGITYPSICELKRQACLTGRAIPLAYRGRCIGQSDRMRCTRVRDEFCVEPEGFHFELQSSSMELLAAAALPEDSIFCHGYIRWSEAATCETIKCKDRQHCLTDLKTHKPRCVSCSYKCPRMKRQQSHGKPFRNARNNPYGEQSVKLCGTNNRTYHSWCHMQKDSCNTGFYIDVQHSGSCAFGR